MFGKAGLTRSGFLVKYGWLYRLSPASSIQALITLDRWVGQPSQITWNKPGIKRICKAAGWKKLILGLSTHPIGCISDSCWHPILVKNLVASKSISPISFQKMDLNHSFTEFVMPFVTFSRRNLIKIEKITSRLLQMEAVYSTFGFISC